LLFHPSVTIAKGGNRTEEWKRTAISISTLLQGRKGGEKRKMVELRPSLISGRHVGAEKKGSGTKEDEGCKKAAGKTRLLLVPSPNREEEEREKLKSGGKKEGKKGIQWSRKPNELNLNISCD